ncbi:MAG: M56 family metallopeptidase [Paramuribaculum sp.]|nr:M56 family metallopeptidase [Paramuribaculum sp.]
MASENQHGFNRGVIMAIYFVSFTLFPVVDLFKSSGARINIEPITVVGFNSAPKWIDTSIIPRVLLGLYLIGVVVMLMTTINNYRKLVQIIRKGKKVIYDGKTVVVTEDNSVAPFSWMKYIVLPEKDFNDKGDVIVSHERQHLYHCHWVDLLVAQVVLILNWFNPAAWLMREELKTVHEYQADMGVIASGADMKSYQMLLISKAVGRKFPGLANSLNHSKLKKRINMMLSTRKSTVASKMRSLFLVPAVAVVCVIVSLPAVGRTLNDLRKASFAKKELPANVKVIHIKPSGQESEKIDSNPVIFLNGKEIDGAEMKKLNPHDIKDISVRKDKGGAGEIYIRTK